jgi:aryl-alcohol dehydrogenase-like predicted oxidoreductase
VQTQTLGNIGLVSRLTLGGGGIGQGWGPTTRVEAVATIEAAIDAGIDVIDTAPLYLNCESIVGETFGGRPPSHVRITSKCGLGSPPPDDVERRIVASLDASLRAMKLERIDVFFLHSYICPDDFVFSYRHAQRHEFATYWSLYRDRVVPTFERLKRDGRIGAWGITGIGVPDTIVAALDQAPRPQVVQVVANLLDSPGSLRMFAAPAQPRVIVETAVRERIGTMGIRAVQAGALTRAFDRPVSPNNPDRRDYDRAAPFRALCERWNEDPAVIAHRYALTIPGVDTVVLGVKNRAELAQCLAAAAAGPLDASMLAAIDGLGLRSVAPL